MVSSPRPLRATEPWVDNVARWQALLSDFPEASFAFNGGWFYGALRDDDDVMRANDLGLLIDRLMARETYPDNPNV